LDGIRVLLVEDSPEIRDLFICYLTAAGADVATASDGEQGLEKAQRGSFDVVLMDIQMPRMDGYQAVATLREKHYPSPVIALTAHAMNDQRQRCANAGFDDFLTKPIEPSLLVETVKRMALATKKLVPVPLPATPARILDQERITGSSAKVKSIFARFVDGIPGEIDEMKRAAAANDWENLMRLAHRFQGSAGSCGFTGLRDRASQLQETVRVGPADEALKMELARLETLGALSTQEFERLRRLEIK
jgi:CheY-like chemotaxis protein/HPt (histidine-containing phosphotransfer) domain-containing protein